MTDPITEHPSLLQHSTNGSFHSEPSNLKMKYMTALPPSPHSRAGICPSRRSFSPFCCYDSPILSACHIHWARALQEALEASISFLPLSGKLEEKKGVGRLPPARQDSIWHMPLPLDPPLQTGWVYLFGTTDWMVSGDGMDLANGLNVAYRAQGLPCSCFGTEEPFWKISNSELCISDGLLEMVQNQSLWKDESEDNLILLLMKFAVLVYLLTYLHILICPKPPTLLSSTEMQSLVLYKSPQMGPVACH